MPNEKTPKSARVVALNEDGSPRTDGVTPLGQCNGLTRRASNGVRLVDLFGSLHAGIAHIQRQTETGDLSADDFFEAFDRLITAYENLVQLAAWIETRRR